MSTTLRVLIAEDSEDDALIAVRHLRRAPYGVEFARVETAEAMRAALARQAWDLILSDFTMPQFSALDALALMQEAALDVPFIIVSGSIGEQTAVAAMKAGASDYLMKDNLARLIPVVERELREAEVRRERKRLAEQLLQSQKMEVVGRLAGGVAHDFNNLLTVILGYTEMAADLLPPDDPARECLALVAQATDRASGLTRQLLAFARQQVITPRVVDLNELIRNLDKMLRRLIGEDIDLVTLPESQQRHVLVDPGQIEQVIVNLAVNARDAMPDGGSLTIETGDVTLDSSYARIHSGVEPGQYVMLAVSDTGFGMNADVQAHIFEPFFTTKEPGKGTGLGLATCYGIVNQSGGHIWVYSEPGRGTTFKVYLPRATEVSEHGAIQASTAAPTAAATETVLLVEDEPMVRAIAEQTLRNQGYTVLTASNGTEAIVAADGYGRPIRLLLTDVIMPQMGGLELAGRLRVARPDLRVLYTSGYTDNAVALHGELMTGVAFLQKPFTPAALLQKVRECLTTIAQV